MNQPKFLPKQQLEQWFKIPSIDPGALELEQLKSDLPAAYCALACLAMPLAQNAHLPLEKLSVDKLTSTIVKHHICWQKLQSPEKKPPEDTLAEIVVVIIKQQLHILYFQLSAEPLLKMAVTDFPSACKAYSQLLMPVIDKLKEYGKNNRCTQIVSDVYNPHIQQSLVQSGFKIEGQGGNNPIMPSKRLVLGL